MKDFLYKRYHHFLKLHYFLLWLLGKLNHKTYPARMACLGKDVFSSMQLINEQKLRVDLFLNILKNGNGPRYDAISPFIKRSDILPLISQQTSLDAFIREIRCTKFFLMDSYSELVDQEFKHRADEWSFCANYSDIEHSSDFEKIFYSKGLLPVEEIQNKYVDFFNEIWKLNSTIKIIFIHFPTLLDDRIHFKERGQAILTAISNIKDPRLINIQVPADKVFANALAPFPYHFSPETTYEIQQMIKKRVNLL